MTANSAVRSVLWQTPAPAAPSAWHVPTVAPGEESACISLLAVLRQHSMVCKRGLRTPMTQIPDAWQMND